MDAAANFHALGQVLLASVDVDKDWHLYRGEPDNAFVPCSSYEPAAAAFGAVRAAVVLHERR